MAKMRTTIFKKQNAKIIIVNFLVVALIVLFCILFTSTPKKIITNNTTATKTSKRLYDRDELIDLWKKFPRTQGNGVYDSYSSFGQSYPSAFLKNLVESFGIRVDQSNPSVLFGLQYPINGPEFVPQSPNTQDSIFNKLEQRYKALQATEQPDLNIVIKSYNFRDFNFEDLEILSYFSDEIRTITFVMESKDAYGLDSKNNALVFPDFTSLYQASWLKDLTKLEGISFVNSVSSKEVSANIVSLTRPTDRGYINLNSIGSILHPISASAASKFSLSFSEWNIWDATSGDQVNKRTLFVKNTINEENKVVPQIVDLQNNLLIDQSITFISRLSLKSRVLFAANIGDYSTSIVDPSSSILLFSDKNEDFYKLGTIGNSIYIEKSSSSGLVDPNPEVGLSNILVGYKDEVNVGEWKVAYVEPIVFNNSWYWNFSESFFGGQYYLVKTRLTCSFLEPDLQLPVYLINVTTTECKNIVNTKSIRSSNLNMTLKAPDGGIIVSPDSNSVYSPGYNSSSNFASDFKSYDRVSAANYKKYFGNRLSSVAVVDNGKELIVNLDNKSRVRYGYFLENGFAWLDQTIEYDESPTSIPNPSKIRFYNETNGEYYESYRAIPTNDLVFANLYSVQYESPQQFDIIPSQLIEKYNVPSKNLNLFDDQFRNFITNLVFAKIYSKNDLDKEYLKTGKWIQDSDNNHINFGSSPFYFYSTIVNGTPTNVRTNIPAAKLYGGSVVNTNFIDNDFNPKNYLIKIDGVTYTPEIFSQLTSQTFSNSLVNDPTKPSNFFYANNLSQFDFSKIKLYFMNNGVIELYTSIEIAMTNNFNLFNSSSIAEMTQVGNSLTVYDRKRDNRSLISLLQNPLYSNFQSSIYNVNTISHPGSIKNFINTTYGSNLNPFINSYLRKVSTINEILNVEDPRTLSNQVSLNLFLQTINTFKIKIDGEIIKLAIIGGRIYWDYKGEWTSLKYSYNAVSSANLNRNNFIGPDGVPYAEDDDRIKYIEFFTSFDKVIYHKGNKNSWADYKQLGVRSDSDPLNFATTPQKTSYILPKYSDLTRLRPLNSSVLVDSVSAPAIIKQLSRTDSSGNSINTRILIWKSTKFPKYISISGGGAINYYTEGFFPIPPNIGWTNANAINSVNQLDFLTEISTPDDFTDLIVNGPSPEVQLKDVIAPTVRTISEIYDANFVSSLIIGSGSGALPSCEFKLIRWSITWVCGNKKILSENSQDIANIRFLERDGNIIRILSSLNQSSFWNLQISNQKFIDSVIPSTTGEIPSYIIDSENNILSTPILNIRDPKSIDDAIKVKRLAFTETRDSVFFELKEIATVQNTLEDGSIGFFWEDPSLIRTIGLVYEVDGELIYYSVDDIFVSNISDRSSSAFSLINNEFSSASPTTSLSKIVSVIVNSPVPLETSKVIRTNTFMGLIIVICVSFGLILLLVGLVSYKVWRRKKTVEVI
jgi:hypothetical protein